MATDTIVHNSEMARAGGQFSTFFVADMFFGVDVIQVQEVLRAQQMSPVPQAPDIIEGLINLRGQIVTAIDMRRRLQIPPRAGDQEPMNMVVRTSDGAVSLLVDEIGDVLDMDASAWERPPENLDPAARELIRGVYKVKDRLLLVLDTERAVEVSTSQFLRTGSHDNPSSEGSAARRNSASALANDGANESSDHLDLQASARKGNKKAAAQKPRGGTRGRPS